MYFQPPRKNVKITTKGINWKARQYISTGGTEGARKRGLVGFIGTSGQSQSTWLLKQISYLPLPLVFGPSARPVQTTVLQLGLFTLELFPVILEAKNVEN